MAKYLDNVGTAYLIEKIKEMSVKTIEPNDQYLKDFAQGVYQATAGGNLFYTTQDDEVTVSVGDIISINIEDSNVYWVIIGNGHQYWGTANGDGSGTFNEGDKSPIVVLHSLADAPEPTNDNINHLYIYDRTTYKWWTNGENFNDEITNNSTRYKQLDGTTGEVITASNMFTYVTPFLPVYPNSSYNGYTHWNTNKLSKYACYYDENQNFISSFSYSGTGSPTETYLTNIPTNAKYIRFSYYYSNTGTRICYYVMGLKQAFVSASNPKKIVYATDSSGEQTTLPYTSTLATGSTIVQRESTGQIVVPETPSASTDATSKSYVDGKTVPTEWQTPTINSTYISSGNIKYCEIGDIVILQMWDVRFTQQAVNEMGSGSGLVLISGLPLGAIGVFNLISDGAHIIGVGNSGSSSWADGEIHNWWSSPYNTTAFYRGEIVYVKNKYR